MFKNLSDKLNEVYSAESATSTISPRLVAYLVLPVALTMLYLGMLGIKKQRQLREEGVRIEATVTGAFASGGVFYKSRRLQYRFEAPHPESTYKTTYVGSVKYRGTKPVHQVELLYLPSDPRIAARADAKEWIWSSAFFLLLGLAILFFSVYVLFFEKSD